MKFVLNPRLEADSEWICDLPLSQIRLSNNAAFPWVILVPRCDCVTEIVDLAITDQEMLLAEIRAVSLAMQQLFQPKKLNVANLGNVVSQLHIHVIARYEDDKAWPNPVWNTVSAEYAPKEKELRIQQLANLIRATCEKDLALS